MRTGRALVLASALLLTGTAAVASPRPELGSGACLSCHGGDVATLPSQPCITCHSGNMEFLKGHEGADSGLWLIGAAGGGGLALAALVLLVGVRRVLPGAACLGLALLAASPATPPAEQPALPGAELLAKGFACDLSPCVSPDGSSLLFARRGPDTDGDGVTDLRDGLAVFLLRRGWSAPRRITPYALDVQASMAAWSPDGARFVLPVPASGARPSGLALFGAGGREVSFMASLGGETISPMFSPDGSRIAFVEGSGIGLWDPRRGTRTWALEPLTDGQFPRLCGWSPAEDAPLFTRGFDYARLERNADHVRVLPPEVPLECARDGRPVTLTPPGPAPLRRFKAQPSADGVFYLAQAPQGAPGLFFFDGSAETRWSPEGVAISGFQALSDGTCWAWRAEAGGFSRLVRFEGPSRWAADPVTVRANLAALCAGPSGTAWASGEPAQGKGRRLFRSGAATPAAAAEDIYAVAAGGGALAFVQAVPSERDGSAQPWDRARLWVKWEAP